MIANRILDALVTVLAPIVIPVQFVTTLVLGLLASLSFGLLLLPLSLLWLAMLTPMIAASGFCSRVEVLRSPIGLLGIPWAVVAWIYVCLMPSMGELESRAAKMMLAESWPFTWECWQFQIGRLDIHVTEGDRLRKLLGRISRNDPVKQRTVQRLGQREQLDPQGN